MKRLDSDPVAVPPREPLGNANLTPPPERVRQLNAWPKRALDIVLGLLILLFISPLLILIAILVKVSSPGPVFYRQKRIGRAGQPFFMLKFRSMYIDSDDLLQALLKSCPYSAEEWATYQKLRFDPRVTRVGAFIRKTSLDELPQIFNVLAGDMSLVGHRPILPSQIAEYGPHFDTYKVARPGITGLWQVSGRNQLSFEKRAEMGSRYTRNWSLWLDFKILLRTVPAVLFPKGAY